MPSSVTVTATRATDIAQLTTTFTAASAPQTQAPNNDDNSSSSNNSNDDNDDDQNGDLNGAGVLVPFGAAGAFVAGAMALLA